jgi:uncharacterized Zn-finger protein
MEPGCKRSFVAPKDLRRHRKVHTREKSFQCGFNNCPRVFSRKDNRDRHVRCHVRENEQPNLVWDPIGN